MKRLKNNSLVRVLLFSFILSTLLLTGLLGLVTYKNIGYAVEETYAEITKEGVLHLEQFIDREKYIQLKENPTNTELYKELHADLTSVLRHNTLTYLYVVTTPKEGTDAMTLVDAGDVKSGEAVALGEPMKGVNYNLVLSTLEDEDYYSEVESTEDYGLLMTSYYPLKDKNGVTFALLGVDTELHNLTTMQFTLLRKIMPPFILLVFLTNLVIMNLIGYFALKSNKPLEVMAGALEVFELGKTISTQEVLGKLPVKSNTDIGELSFVLNKVLRSTIKLIMHVKRLVKKIEDTNKTLLLATEDVKEITGLVRTDLDTTTKDLRLQITKTVGLVDIVSVLGKSAEGITSTVDTNGESLTTVLTTLGGNVTHTEQIVDFMRSVANGVTETSKEVEQLSDISKRVESATSVIDTIAEQTNLLALNASIEAAKAGEYGKGFAVVADEVKKLANLTKRATVDIDKQLTNNREVTEKALISMLKSKANTEEAVTKVILIQEELRMSFNSLKDVVYELQKMTASSKDISDYSAYITTLLEAFSETNEKMTRELEELNFTVLRQANATETCEVVVHDLQGSVTEIKELVDTYKQQ